MSVNLGRINVPTVPKPLPTMQIEFKPPSARVPFYKPMVIPPSDLEAPEEVEPEKTQERGWPTLGFNYKCFY